MTRHQRLFRTLAVLWFAILAPLLGTLGFLIGFGVGMTSFAPPRQPTGWDAERVLSTVLICISNFPIPGNWFTSMGWLSGRLWLDLRIFNMVVWAGLFAWLIAYFIARHFRTP